MLLREYEESLKPSDVNFDKMEIWVRILNIPFGWMNSKRGSRAAGLVGKLIKLDIGANGKASGPYLRARVAIEIDKPLRRGILLQAERNAVQSQNGLRFSLRSYYWNLVYLLYM